MVFVRKRKKRLSTYIEKIAVDRSISIVVFIIYL